METLPLDKKAILNKYSDYILRHNHSPKNIYSFCEDNEMSENDFYIFFANFEEVEKEFLVYFFEESLFLLGDDLNYSQMDDKTKLLSLYYTYFEQLTMNRSLIMVILKKKNPLERLKKLSKLKVMFIDLIKTLNIVTMSNDLENSKLEKLEKYKNKGVEELFWNNFLVTLKFWMDDTSSSFEKTDIFIEKSVEASFELINTKPLEKLLDFGKFIWKEKVGKF
ncbi:TetR family transcriptional regulator C-terminal domain-containing protein [Halpernia sp.]|uniref:TetR family transcriptional regulator C-terminal domain-containing protein n=1 Tax=Halpernia sp. TaxID=2782209 RepID=UPI003A92DCA3